MAQSADQFYLPPSTTGRITGRCESVYYGIWRGLLTLVFRPHRIILRTHCKPYALIYRKVQVAAYTVNRTRLGYLRCYSLVSVTDLHICDNVFLADVEAYKNPCVPRAFSTVSPHPPSFNTPQPLTQQCAPFFSLLSLPLLRLPTSPPPRLLPLPPCLLPPHPSSRRNPSLPPSPPFLMGSATT